MTGCLDQDFPSPADPAAAERLLRRWSERAGAPSPGLARLLACLGGNAPYLADAALREPATIAAIERDGLEQTSRLTIAAVQALSPLTDRRLMAAGLRQAKRQLALVTAIADLAEAWPLEQVTGALSDLADAALAAAVDHLLAAAAARGELSIADLAEPSRGCGFTVLAMGKLGARELNYSSDVDLILLYDPAPLTAGHAAGPVFVRLARDLVGLMQTRDADGYVFRTDLRLRPDPGSTPIATSLPAALSYYESLAQTWERAAMIKARPVAGDLELGASFLAAIRPFVWRRHLDFAALADIRTMKRRIDAQRPPPPTQGSSLDRLLGRNLKLGRGGIREIEFSAQAMQLVWGGRQPALRVPGTLAALHALVAERRLPGERAARLEAAYRALRRAEHRLQMVHDHQTHSLPQSAAGFAAFATFLGAADPATAAAALLGHMEAVHEAYAEMLDGEPPAASRIDAEAFGDPAQVATTLAAWRAGRPRGLRTGRARELLEKLLPSLLAALAAQPRPALALARLDSLLARLPAGVQLLSLLEHNPALLARLAAVLGAAPLLADHLAAVPAALEGLLAPPGIDPDPAAMLNAALADDCSLEALLVALPPLLRGEEFRLALAELEDRSGVDAAGRARTALAETVIRLLLPAVLLEHRRRFGRLRGGGMVVVALGKAGSREMLAGSDLDLMLVYDQDDAVGQSTAAGRRLPASQYYARLAQALIAALTVPTAQGRLYEVDMRLRPSGRQGPVAVSLASFVRYHESAWTWERMALTRARVVAGPRTLAAKARRAIRAALLASRPPEIILADAAAMRARLARDLPQRGPWDVKNRPGGLIEVEFVAQALQLIHTGHPRVLHPTTATALARLAAAGLLGTCDATLLIHADRLWRGVIGLLAITVGRTPPAGLPAPVISALARVAGLGQKEPTDEAALSIALDAVAEQVREIFNRLIGPTEDDHADR